MGGVCNLNKNDTDSSNLTLISDRNAINNLQIQKINDSSCFKPRMLAQRKMYSEDPIKQNTTKLDLKDLKNLRIEYEIAYTDINLTPKGILKSPQSKSQQSKTPDFYKRNTSKSNNTQNRGDKCFKSQKKRKPKVTFEILDNLF